MRQHLPAAILGTAIVALVGGVAWSGGAFGYADRPPTFNLTGVGALGRWTLQPVTGLNYAWSTFSAATLYVQTGDEVVIHLRSADVFHRFYLPEFSVGPMDIEPGHTVTVRFRASRKGVFQYYCTSMCGACHFYMRGWLVVADPGEPRIVPPSALAVCQVRQSTLFKLPEGASLVQRGAILYEHKGCITCHAPGGRGGVRNDNSTSGTVPAHNTTAQKLFLLTPEDAAAFVQLLEASGDLEAVEDTDVNAFPAVRTRFRNAREIIRKGRFTSAANPLGPQPPLQMPAWGYLLDEREIDALLAYFVSLYDWEKTEQP